MPEVIFKKGKKEFVSEIYDTHTVNTTDGLKASMLIAVENKFVWVSVEDLRLKEPKKK